MVIKVYVSSISGNKEVFLCLIYTLVINSSVLIVL